MRCARKVREIRADIGIALDGDADRVVLIDERGHLIDGDQIMAVIAESWKDEGRLAKPGVVATVMSNLGLERFLESNGHRARPHRGRRPLRARGDAQAAATTWAARPSGHIILSDYATTGDGLVAALQVLAVVKKLGRPASEGVPPLRAAAAGDAQRALQEGQAARERQGGARHQERRAAARMGRAGW